MSRAGVNFGTKIEVSITIRIEPRTNHCAQRNRRFGSGNHSSSFLTKIVTNTIGKINTRYQGAPQRSNKCRNVPKNDRPNIPAANKAAKVTLRPRQARQNQENPEKMFTRCD